MLRKKRVVLLVSGGALALAGAAFVFFFSPACCASRPLPPGQRPGAWAQPVALEGAPNLHRIHDGLYRGAQPTAVGIANLKKMGIKTILNLRSSHGDLDEIGTTGIAYEVLPMTAYGGPGENDVVRFLQLTTDQARAPLFFHCQHGADRTGLMCAVYRVAVQGWDKEEAIREMTRGGFGYHAVWGNLQTFLRELDVARVRKLAGL